jgi:hypothetical protein
MSGTIYISGSFMIFRSGKGFVVYNRAKDFKGGHTHLNNFNAGKKAIKLVQRKIIPTRSSNYFLESLARLSNDIEYSSKLRQIIINRNPNSKTGATEENK